MWAHIGDHVSEYIIYVDNIQTKIVNWSHGFFSSFVNYLLFMIFKINDKDFHDFYGIQFHGAQQNRKYLLHVEAKIKSILYRNKRIRFICFVFV